MTHIKTVPKKIKPKYGQILRTDSFVGLGEVIEEHFSGKEAVKFRVNETKTAYYLRTTKIKKSISINAKLRHYATAVRQEAFYGAECLTLNNKMMMEELAIAERRILRKIL